MRKGMYLLFLLTAPWMVVKSQEAVLLGLMPSVNISKKLPKDWSLQSKAESRIKMYQDEADFSYLLTDLSLTAGRKISLRTTLTAGYLIRVEPDAVSHRTIQQLSVVNRYTGFSLSHRLAFDQTFQKEEKAEYRFRYRISGEKSLQGQSVDPGEFYVKFSNEYLYAVQASTADLEIRLTAVAGYALTPGAKLETGPEYRVSSLFNDPARQRIWIGIHLFQTL